MIANLLLTVPGRVHVIGREIATATVARDDPSFTTAEFL